MSREQEPGGGQFQIGEQTGDGGPVRLRDAAGAGQPAGLAEALTDATLDHQPTGAQLDDLRRSLAVALARPVAGAPARDATPRTGGAWRGALAVALLTIGAGALWYGVSAPMVPTPPATGAVAPVGTIVAPTVSVTPSIAAPAASDRPQLELGSRHAAPSRAARPDDELRLVSRAQQALVSEPALAFALAERHRRLFPNGALAQEREVIAIEALRGLQRTDEATARARRFRALYPHSAHLPRVEGRRL